MHETLHQTIGAETGTLYESSSSQSPTLQLQPNVWSIEEMFLNESPSIPQERQRDIIHQNYSSSPVELAELI